MQHLTDKYKHIFYIEEPNDILKPKSRMENCTL